MAAVPLRCHFEISQGSHNDYDKYGIFGWPKALKEKTTLPSLPWPKIDDGRCARRVVGKVKSEITRAENRFPLGPMRLLVEWAYGCR